MGNKPIQLRIGPEDLLDEEDTGKEEDSLYYEVIVVLKVTRKSK